MVEGLRKVILNGSYEDRRETIRNINGKFAYVQKGQKEEGRYSLGKVIFNKNDPNQFELDEGVAKRFCDYKEELEILLKEKDFSEIIDRDLPLPDKVIESNSRYEERRTRILSTPLP